MEFYKEINNFYLAGAILTTIMLVLWVIYYLREKAGSKVLLILKDNIFWWAAVYIFVLMVVMVMLGYNTKSYYLNKILKSWIEISAVLTIVLNCLTKTVLTTKGVEKRLIKGRTRVVAEWSNIIEWSVLSDDKKPSTVTLKYKYKYKEKIIKAEIILWAREKERLIEIFESNVV